MKVSPIFAETIKSIRYGQRRVVHQGGAWSGKTVGILQALAVYCTENSMKVVTVTSMSFPHLKSGALRDFETYVIPEFKEAIKSYHLSNHIITFKTGSIIEFKVFESEFDARGAKRDILFINEANRFIWPIFYQLDSRSAISIIDYNPTARFWAHEKVIGEAGTKLFISDHRHNCFLTESKHREIENQPDKELFRVYARGITGNITGVIFPNWQMIDDSDFSDNEDFTWGIDWGFTIDPTVIMKIYRISDSIFLKECCYEPGLAPIQARNIMIANGYKDNQPVFADHSPDSIRGIRMVGIRAEPARKGQGSINAGIELLKRHKVFYTASSRNLKYELGQYTWTMDKVTGNSLNVPVDYSNHAIDATRYGTYSRYIRNQ